MRLGKPTNNSQPCRRAILGGNPVVSFGQTGGSRNSPKGGLIGCVLLEGTKNPVFCGFQGAPKGEPPSWGFPKQRRNRLHATSFPLSFLPSTFILPWLMWVALVALVAPAAAQDRPRQTGARRPCQHPQCAPCGQPMTIRLSPGSVGGIHAIQACA